MPLNNITRQLTQPAFFPSAAVIPRLPCENHSKCREIATAMRTAARPSVQRRQSTRNPLPSTTTSPQTYLDRTIGTEPPRQMKFRRPALQNRVIRRATGKSQPPPIVSVAVGLYQSGKWQWRRGDEAASSPLSRSLDGIEMIRSWELFPLPAAASERESLQFHVKRNRSVLMKCVYLALAPIEADLETSPQWTTAA